MFDSLLVLLVVGTISSSKSFIISKNIPNSFSMICGASPGKLKDSLLDRAVFNLVLTGSGS